MASMQQEVRRLVTILIEDGSMALHCTQKQTLVDTQSHTVVSDGHMAASRHAYLINPQSQETFSVHLP